MAGAIVAGAATGGVGAAAVLGAAGSGAAVGIVGSTVLSNSTGLGVSPFDIGKNNCNYKEKTAIINTFHQIISYSIFKGIQNCSNQAASRQLVSIGCYPNTTSDTVYEENSICRSCYEENFQGMLRNHELQRALLQKNSTIILPIDKEYETLVYKLSLCGMRHCKACVLTNVTQSSILGSSDQPLSVDCLSQLTNVNQFTIDFTATLNQVLTENTDVLSAVSQVIGAGNTVNEVTQDLVNKTTQVVNKSFLSQILSTIRNNQVITLRMSDGIVTGVTQESVYNSIAKQVNENSLATQIVSDSLLSAISTVLDEQTSLSALGDMVYEPIYITIDTISVAAKYILYGGLAVMIMLTILIISWLIGRLRSPETQIEAFAPGKKWNE